MTIYARDHEPPSGAQLVTQGYRFRVSLPKISTEGDNNPFEPPEFISFKTVRGISEEVETITYRQGDSPNVRMIMPTLVKTDIVTFEHGRCSSQIMRDWLTRVGTNVMGRKPPREAFHRGWGRLSFVGDVQIDVINRGRDVSVRYVLRDAYPVKVSYSPLEATSSEILIESIEMVYHDLVVYYPNPE